MNSSSQQWSADAARASGSPRLVAARGLAVLADRLASLCFCLSLSVSVSFGPRPAKRVFLVWVSFVFDCLVAHVKTKCQTQHAIPTRSREKTEPNPNKTFFISFCSTFVHLIAERDVTFPKNRTDLFCASANSILSRSTKAERILSRTFP